MSEMKQDAVSRVCDLIQEVATIRQIGPLANFSRLDLIQRRREMAEAADMVDEVLYLAMRSKEVAIECLVQHMGEMVVAIETKGVPVWKQVERDWFDLMALWRQRRYHDMLDILRHSDSLQAAEIQRDDSGQAYSVARLVDGKTMAYQPPTGRRARKNVRRAKDEVLVEQALSFVFRQAQTAAA